MITNQTKCANAKQCIYQRRNSLSITQSQRSFDTKNMYRYMRFTRLVKQTQLHTQNYRIHLTVYTKATSIDTMFFLQQNQIQ